MLSHEAANRLLARLLARPIHGAAGDMLEEVWQVLNKKLKEFSTLQTRSNIYEGLNYYMKKLKSNHNIPKIHGMPLILYFQQARTSETRALSSSGSWLQPRVTRIGSSSSQKAGVFCTVITSRTPGTVLCRTTPIIAVTLTIVYDGDIKLLYIICAIRSCQAKEQRQGICVAKVCTGLPA